MFQRSGPGSSRAGEGAGTPSQQESDQAFLERNGVPQMMRGLLNKLVETRPAQPLAVMAEYFRSQRVEAIRKRRLIKDGNFASIDVPAASVLQALKHLESGSWHSPSFIFHLNSAYETLGDVNHGKDGGSRKHRLKAVNGELVNELISNILRDVSKGDLFIKQMKLKPFWLIPFDVFRYLATTAFIFKEFVSLTSSLYADLVPTGTNKEERVRCKSILRLLEDNLSIRDKISPKNALTATKNMSAQEVDKLLTQIPASSQIVAPSLDEFLDTSVNRFLEGLPNIK